VSGERFVQNPDIRELAARLPDDPRVQLSIAHGLRTALFVPLRKEADLLGYISAFRDQIRPFSDREIALVENFAAQAVIAIENARLLTELRQRTDELARRNSEYGERIEHQAATIDVLKAMSASPGDPQPVFDLIAQQAAE